MEDTPHRIMLIHPYMMCNARLLKLDSSDAEPRWMPTNALTGNQAASLQVRTVAVPRKAGSHNHSKPGKKQDGLFVFNNLQVKEEGRYILEFTLRVGHGIPSDPRYVLLLQWLATLKKPRPTQPGTYGSYNEVVGENGPILVASSTVYSPEFEGKVKQPRP
jgi:hypothetical protein